MPGSAQNPDLAGPPIVMETLCGILKRVEGARAVALVASDGMTVHREGERRDPDLALLTAHMFEVLRRAEHAGEDTAIGQTAELVQMTSKHALVLRRVDSKFFLLIVLDRDGIVGRARWESFKAAERLKDELA